MKRASFFLRLFVGNLLLVAIIITLGAGIFYNYLNRYYQGETKQHQIDLLHLAREIVRQRWPVDRDVLQQTARELFSEGRYRLEVFDTEGQRLSDSREGETTRKVLDRPEVLVALEGRQGMDVRDDPTTRQPWRHLAEPLRQDGRVVGAVCLAMPIETVVEEQAFLRSALFWGVLAMGVAAVILGLLVSWIWYRPLRSLSRTARQIASGNLAHPPHVSGAAELDDLSEALDEMRLTVSKQLNTIGAQRENLRTILSNLTEGVIALDADGAIVFMNASARELVAPEDEQPEGSHLQSVVRIADLVDIYEEAITRDEPFSRQAEMEIGRRRRMLAIDVIRPRDASSEAIDTLLVISDVTDLSRASAMKAEFVANASHELRTPLATLRAAVDSLHDIHPMDEDLQKLSSMIERNVGRLEDMTQDLLDLHTVEASPTNPQQEEVDLQLLAEKIRSLYSPRATDKSVHLDVEARPDDQIIFTNRGLLELIIQNLVDNAVKFTPSDGTVQCSLVYQDRVLNLRVSDTGCGIAPEDQSKVFDRFFQSETSRTGDTRVRGSGLGLAIVKHAADRLNASLDLQSQPGEGTVVNLIIPVLAGNDAEQDDADS